MAAAPRTLLEAQDAIPGGGRSVFQTLIVIAAVLFLFLPFVTTFNEFLTAVVVRLGVDALLRDWVVPFETRLMVVLIRPLGLSTEIVGDTLHIFSRGRGVPIRISWNCVGWQSLVLLGFTLAAGLQGAHTAASKGLSILIGLLGTFLVNLFRLVSVALVAYYLGRLPAVLYHDYGGTLMLLAWLFVFWWFVQRAVLVPQAQAAAA